jgi:hypothetical protein
MSAEAPAFDNDGNLFITVGNGSVGFVLTQDLTNRGESLLKLVALQQAYFLLFTRIWFSPVTVSLSMMSTLYAQTFFCLNRH